MHRHWKPWVLGFDVNRVVFFSSLRVPFEIQNSIGIILTPFEPFLDTAGPFFHKSQDRFSMDISCVFKF